MEHVFSVDCDTCDGTGFIEAQTICNRRIDGCCGGCLKQTVCPDCHDSDSCPACKEEFLTETFHLADWSNGAIDLEDTEDPLTFDFDGEST